MSGGQEKDIDPESDIGRCQKLDIPKIKIKIKTSARDCGTTLTQGRFTSARVGIEPRCTLEGQLELSPESIEAWV